MASPAQDAVAEAIRAVTNRRRLSNAELARRVSDVRGTAIKFGDVWASKRLTGKVALVTPTNEFIPNQDLIDIAAALEMSVADLLREALTLSKYELLSFVVDGELLTRETIEE